jgi:hypothetical protein
VNKFNDGDEMKQLVITSPGFWASIERLAGTYDCDLVRVPLTEDEGGPFYILSPRSL